MDKKAVYHIIGWIVALAACGYLVYRLAIYDDYPSLWASLVGMGWQQYMALVLCVLLMPVNMTIEAWKWKTLIPMTWYEAHREVYYSKLAGLVTPWRLGEYPSRALLRGEWKQTLSMGAVGSATMTIAIIAAGLTAMILEIGDWRLEIGYYLLVGAVLLLLILALIFSPLLLRRWATVSHRLILISVGQSFIRLACWCVQLALVLYALGAYQSPITTYQLPIYYLLVTITPNVPIAEVGVRGSWAIVLFGSMNAALAGVLLWGINTLLPCLISLFFAKNNKTFA
jgi:hypothetical protein